MEHYYVNTNVSSTGVHEVHRDGCIFIPKVTQRNYLGLYITSREAVKDANIFYLNATACIHCLKESHAKIGLKIS